jgi:hypothetical protein
MRFPAGDDIDQNAEISEKIGKYRVSFFFVVGLVVDSWDVFL